MHSRPLPNRRGGMGSTSSPSTLPPFLLGSSQSPPQQRVNGLSQSAFLSSASSSSLKHPVSRLNQSRTSASPKGQHKDVASTAPPVEGLFENQAGQCSPFPAESGRGHDVSGGSTVAASAAVEKAGVLFPDGQTAVQKFSHQMGDLYVSGASPNLVPVTPFAGTQGCQYVGTPPVRPSPHPFPLLDGAGEPVNGSTAAAALADSVSDQCWVTVFGFPPDAADYILQEFSHCGTIVHHSMDINTNWMHICYQSVLQAKKAQGKNCKILMSRMMVGVVPCTDDKLMQSYASLEQSEPISAQNVASPILSGQASVGLQRQRPASIRSMTVSYQQGAPEQMANEMGAGVPRKADGVLGKAMEYMFGW